MISLCQDVSISYEYHVYENKTLKKIVHKRNGSKISEKNSVKSSKLSLVSKSKEQIKPIVAENLNEVKLGKKSSSNQKQKRNKHMRCWSNYVQSEVNSSKCANFQAPAILPNQLSLHEKSMGPLYEIKKETIRPLVHFNQPLKQPLPERKEILQPPNKTFCTNSSQAIIFNGSLYSRSIRAAKYMDQKKKEVLKMKPLIRGSIQSNQQEIELNNFKRYTRANSLSTNQTPVKQNLQKIESSTIEDFISMQRQFAEYDHNQKWTSRQNSFNQNFENQNMVGSLETQNNHIPQNSLFIGPHSRSQNKLTQKRQLLGFGLNNFFDKPIKIENSQIFDAKSAFSNNFYDENEELNKSIVEQRNFFFQKQQNHTRSFNKSIQSLLFHDPGYFALSEKWILFKNVEEKDNKKMYSVKSFSTKNEKQYFNEYEIYMTLKTETFELINQSRQNNIFLNLFSALSNNQEQKFYLIKENFDYSLDDYIKYLRSQSFALENSKKFLQIENAIIFNQITEIVKFFSLKGISLSKNQELETKDFVVCKSEPNGNLVVKLHNLYKFQKNIGQKLTFCKLRKLKSNSSLNNQFYDLKQNAIKTNLGSIQKNIFQALFI